MNILVKVGGEVVDDASALAAFADNVRALTDAGHAVVVVHGGGPQVTRLQERLGQKAHKVAGQRVTGKDDIDAVVSALCGTVNVTLCAALLRAGVRAFGGHGASLIRARKRPPADVPGHGVVDYGEVGDIDGVDVDVLDAIVAAGAVPVVATLGLDRAAGRVLNINGDTAAAAVARAWQGRVVFLVTSVGGVFRTLGDPSSRLPRLTVRDARARIADGTISGGMIPKVDEALALVEGGVERVVIVDANAGAFSDVLAERDRGTVFVGDVA